MNEPLPEWATGLAKGEYVKNALLATRDGRRHGNARIVGIEWKDGLGYVFRCITDAGNAINYTLNELKEGFHPPVYIGTESPLELAQHELAILHDHYKLYPGAWCCEGARASNGWHHRESCKNWVLVF